MAFPSGTNIDTANLQPTSDPSQARADLLALIETFNQLINSENGANGVLTLNASGKVQGNQIPGTLAPTGNMVLAPEGGAVTIESVLRLTQLLTVELDNLTSSAGDVVYLTDGDAGSPCLGVYDGSNWRVVRFATTVGDTGGAFTSAFALSATADI